MGKIKKNYICGGIGDFLQVYPYIINNLEEKYIIHSHFKDAKKFFNFLPEKNSEYIFFSDIKELNLQKIEIFNNENEEIKIVERKYFYDFPVSKEIEEDIKNKFTKNLKIIGIHPFGSKFANEYANSNNLVIKYIDPEIIYESIDNKINYLIFGTKEELENYNFYEKENVKFICYNDILSSLSAVKLCDLFIGTDSCFKNAACINKIKTFCILGDYKDDFRDLFFIKPYTEERVLDIFQINKNTNQNEIKQYIRYAHNAISK
jgi:hypothetical protein